MSFLSINTHLCRVFDVIDKNRADREVSLDAADKEFNVGTECDSLIGDRGIGIQTNDLSFSYPSRPSENVLKGISITVKPRQLVAFVGKSGSGKSTLLSIIAGLYLCKDGEVTMGGYDLSRSHSLVLNQVCPIYFIRYWVISDYCELSMVRLV